MTYEQFKLAVMDAAKESIDDILSVSIEKVLKNNGVEYDALNIKNSSSNLSPTIYLNEYYSSYKNGTDFDEITSLMFKTYDERRLKGKFDTSFYLKYSPKVKNHVIFKLVNRKKNEALLETVPHVDFLDLSVVFYFFMDEYQIDEGTGSILIKNEHIGLWGIDKDELMRDALVNTPRLLGLKVDGIFSTIAHYLGDDSILDMAKQEDLYTPLYVATNNLARNGAAVILYKDMLKDLSERLNSDLYIIPCSINEIIIAKIMEGFDYSTDSLREMIYMVNRDELKEEDILSDNLYFYSRTDNKLVIA